MAYDYRRRVAIVTGASSGIGRVIAQDLARRGTTVIGVARRADRLEEVAAECRRTAPASEGRVADVSDRQAIESVVLNALERHGKVDVLVNNAGVPLRIHASRLTVEDVERVMGINFMGPVYATLAVLPSMLERRDGRIVNVSSVAGRMGAPREAAYSASKFALAGWSEVMAGDLHGTGVRVHLVIPGAIRTEIWGRVEEQAAWRGRLAPPEVVSRAVLKCLETGSFERWAPRWYRAVTLLHTASPGTYVRNAARYDRRGGGPGSG